MLGTETTLSRAPQRSKSIVASTTVTASVVNTTETALHSSTFPANTLVAGDVIRVEIFGRITTSSPPTIRLRLRWGGIAGTVLLDTDALTPTDSVTNGMVRIEALIAVRSATSFWSSGLIGFGYDLAEFAPTRPVVQNKAFNTAGGQTDHSVAASAAVTVATNADKDLTLSAQYSGNTASNSITVDAVLITTHRQS